MSINKKYMIAGALATAFVLPMSNVTDSHAASMRTITGRVNFRSGPNLLSCKIHSQKPDNDLN